MNTTPISTKKGRKKVESLSAKSVDANGVKKITEAEFMRQVIRLAQLLGWKVAHFRPARTNKGWRTPVQGDGAGFPDLILGRGPGHAIRLIAAELKVGNNKPTPQQYAWLGHFEAQGVPSYVWTPDCWGDIRAILEQP